MTAAVTATYADTHHTYRQAGWPGPLPLPEGAKWPPPEGWTGYAGAYPSFADSLAWCDDDDYGTTRQTALRLADGVIGIDVDHYGDKTGADTIAEAERRWGPLPDAPYSSARGAGPSGIRYFRVPPGTTLRTVIRFTELGLGHVEIIQRHHRYAVVWPSLHPDTGDPYLWHNTAHPDAPPNAERLPPLPQAWIEALAATGKGSAHAEASPAAVQAFHAAHDGGGDPSALRGVVAVFDRNVRTGSSRHDSMNEAACMAAREVRAGRYPAELAAATLRDKFVNALTTGGNGQRKVTPAEAAREFAGIWAWAVAQVLPLEPSTLRAEQAARDTRTSTGSTGGRVLGTGRTSPLAGPPSWAAPVTPPTGHDHDDGGERDGQGMTPHDHATASADALRDALGEESYADIQARTFDALVDERVRQMDVADAAKQRRAARDRIGKPAFADRLLSFADLASVQPPKMCVARLVPDNSVGFVNGRSGAYKSFLLVALACGIGTGQAVMGEFAVAARGKVLYVAGEGFQGVALRLRAYAHAHDLDEADVDVTVYPGALNLSDPDDVADLYGHAAEHSYTHVFVDTWRANTPGVQEKDNTEISVVMHHALKARDEQGVSTLYADHTGHAGERAVGGEAKWANADYALMMNLPTADRRADQQRTLTVEKLKDAETGGQWDVRLRPVTAIVDADGTPSAILDLGQVESDDADPFGLAGQPWWNLAVPDKVADKVTGKAGRAAALDALRVLRLIGGGRGVTAAELRSVVDEGPRKHAKGSWYSGVNALRELDLIEEGDTSSRFVLAGHVAALWEAEQGPAVEA